jgi:hypothetical protein
MLASYFESLQTSIQWAQFEEDLDVLMLARENMDELVRQVNDIPQNLQQLAYRQIDELLPMEWPFWMEVCRNEEIDQVLPPLRVLH